MQRLLVVFALTLVATPLAGAAPDPQRLVLRQADLPRSFELDRILSGVSSNADLSEDEPELRRVVAQAERVTGYEAIFRRTVGYPAAVESTVHVFRRARGAQMFLRTLDAQVRDVPAPGYRRSRVRVGTQAWLYAAGRPLTIAAVVWRHERVVALVTGGGISIARVVSLARVQQRRIAAAPR